MKEFKLRDQPQQPAGGRMSPEGWKSVRDELAITERDPNHTSQEPTTAAPNAESSHPEIEDGETTIIYRIEHLMGIDIESTKATLISSGSGKPRTFTRHKNPDGKLGGFVEGTATVDAGVTVDPTSMVVDAATATGSSSILEQSILSGGAELRDHATITKGSKVSGSSQVSGNAMVSESQVLGRARVTQNAQVLRNSTVGGESMVSGNAIIDYHSGVSEKALVLENVTVYNRTYISGDDTIINGSGQLSENKTSSFHVES